ncbi:putative Contactin-associated protein like 5-3 [Hypsibius exemplaris]|uniref:Contactin-associated protein like 5-3 n=1 Tax=Hypsibius exemplaris TaxID=2072580 RepID=A0A1W0X6H2_HYPEX|nr:putative Contactin-associated protein like 5-3 [Hypsibius exemplaris]
MEAFIRICLLVIVTAPLSHQRSYSFLPSNATDSLQLQFNPQSWLTGTNQHLHLKFKTHNPNEQLVHISDGAVSVKVTQGSIEVSTSAPGSATFQDSQQVADGEWHSVYLVRDVTAKTLKLNLNNRGQILVASGVPYVSQDTLVQLGGEATALSPATGAETPDLKGSGFEGCFNDVRFATADEEQTEPTTWEEGAPTRQSPSIVACEDRCLTTEKPCNAGQCRDYIDRLVCDCSQTSAEGPHCSIHEPSIVSLNGVQYVTHKAAAPAKRIALEFKTQFSDGLLLVVPITEESSSSSSNRQQPVATVSVFIARGKYLHVALSYPGGEGGGQSQLEVLTETDVVDGAWHSLVLEVETTNVKVTLDKEQKQLFAKGRKFDSFAADISVGGLGSSHPSADLISTSFRGAGDGISPADTFFVGCLRRIYTGPVNILEELIDPERHSTFLRTRSSVTDSPSVNEVLSTECAQLKQEDLSITLLSEESSAAIPQTDRSQHIDIKFSFRLPYSSFTNGSNGGLSPEANLISGELNTQFGAGDFKILVSDGLKLELNYPDQSGVRQQYRTLKPIGGALANSEWHSLRITWPTDQNGRVKRQDIESATDTTEAEAAVVDGNNEIATESEIVGTVPPPTFAVAAEEGAGHPVEAATDTNAVPAEVTASSQNETVAASEADLTAVEATTGISAEPEAGKAVLGNRRMQAEPAEADPNSVYALPAGVDKKSTLTIELDGVPIEILPGATSVSPNGALVLGKRVGIAGFGGCVRDISDHGRPVDVRRILIKPGNEGLTLGKCSSTSQTCLQNNPCEHDSKCRAGIAGLVCDCTDTGYSGKTCHISLHPPTCTDLFLSGERRSGVHLIDMDGSGPMKPVHVYCNMSRAIPEPRGVTTITHNFTPIKLSDFKSGGVRYEVRYRHFDKAHLKKLVEMSHQCRQFISYKCRNAPLKLGTHSFFRSFAETADITSFGSNTPGKCNCAVGGSVCGLGTRRDLSCNCDADDAQERVDDGYFVGKEFVGITSLTFVNRPIQGSGQVTLGALECFGKEWIERTVSFMSHAGSLALNTLGQNEDITFFFKTALKSTVLLYQPSIGGSGSLRVSVINATTAALYISINGEIRQVSVSSNQSLTNGAWHFIKVQFGTNELRFSVDLNDKYLVWGAGDKVGQYRGQLHIGGYPQTAEVAQVEVGLIGCIKGLFRGSQSVDVEASIETSGSNEIRRGCHSSCTPNPCVNGAECFDKFGDYECICANPLAQSGKNCDRDINDKAVTFETTNSSYILLHSQNVPIFNQSILLSFRTHAPSGILLYAHDNLHNFVQLHLDGNSQVVLTFSNGNKIQKLAVGQGSFSDGKWHQVYVHREATNTSLTVDYIHADSLELEGGLRLLTQYSGRPFGYNTGETIVPARPAYAIMPFQDVYVGGVATANLRAYIPGFYGCLRGLKIGELLFSLKNEPTEPEVPGVTEGCNSVCDHASPCQNSGRCINNWSNKTNPAECDCAGTSYVGATCSEDIGGNLDLSSQLIVDYKPGNPSSRAFDLSHKLAFSLAFSTAVRPEEGTTATLLFVQAYQKLVELAIGLTSNGSVVVYVLTEDDHKMVDVEGDFADGQRHFVTVLTSSDQFIVQSRLRISFNFYLLNLTCGDLFVGCIAMPYFATATYYGRWPISYTHCSCFIFFDFLATSGSLWVIAIISLDRAWAVACPVSYKYHNSSTPKHLVWIAREWVISLAALLLEFIRIRTDYVVHSDPEVCDWNSEKLYCGRPCFA